MGKLIRNIVVLAAGIFLLIYFIGPTLLSAAVEKSLGTKVSVKKLHLSLFPAEVGIYGLRVHNLAGYSEPVLAEIPEIFVRLDVLSFVTGKPRIEKINLNIERITLEKNKNNKINLKELLDFSKRKQKESRRPASPPSSGGGSSEPKSKKTAAAPLRIDETLVNLGEVTFVYDTAGQKTVKKIPLNVDDLILREVTDGYSLIEQIVLEILKRVGVSALGIQMDIFSGDMQKQADQFIQDAKGKLKQIFA